MKNIFALLFITTLCISLSAQSKYMVYFKDKGSSENFRLNKSSELYQKAEDQLSERAKTRRAKILQENEIITYRDVPVSDNYIDILRNDGIKIKRVLNWFNAVSCYLSENQIQVLKGYDFIQKIEPVRQFRRKVPDEQVQTSVLKKAENATTTLDYGNSLTQMELSDVPIVHDMGYSGDGVLIGFVDSGFSWEFHTATNHLNVVWEYDFVYDDNDTGDDGKDSSRTQNVHGTQTVAVACGYDPGRIIGPAYSADVMFGKTEYIIDELNEEEDDFAAAVEEMERRGVDIITTSLGYLVFDNDQVSYTHEDMDGRTSISTIAFETAAQLGVLTITSAGNEGTYGPNNLDGGITAPADGFLTISVGNVNSSNVVSGSSSRGPTADGRIKPELVAMGTDVFSVGNNPGEYMYASGTSFAAPIVAGIAGQLYSAFPHITNLQARQILIESGDNTETPNNIRGWGLLSALRAVTYPNLQSRGIGFRLHKIFYNEDGINSSSVRVHYSVNGNTFLSGLMSKLNENRFYFDLPNLNPDDSLDIYFSYTTSGGTVITEPEGKYFRARYGELQMNLNYETVIPVEIPTEYKLENNYPNPFNNETEISFSIPRNEDISLKIYNTLGEEVITLFSGNIQAGNYFVKWNARNSSGNICSSGVYIYVLVTPSEVLSKKMVYLK